MLGMAARTPRPPARARRQARRRAQPPWKLAACARRSPPPHAACTHRSQRAAADADARTPAARAAHRRGHRGEGWHGEEEGRPRVRVPAAAGLAPPRRAPPSAGPSSTPAVTP